MFTAVTATAVTATAVTATTPRSSSTSCSSNSSLPALPKAVAPRCRSPVKFSRDKLPERVDAVVIGAGQGGLSCASVLAQYGYRVVVFEQHEVIGGGAHTFAVDGKTRWRFDAGLHFTIPWHEQALQLAVGAAAPPVPVPKLGEASGVYERISLGAPRRSR